MVLSRAQHPAPAGAAGATDNAARPLQKRVLDHNREAASLLEYLQTHGSGTPRRVVEFIQASWALTDALSHYPVGDAWKVQLDEMQRAINDIWKDTNELTARTEDPIHTYAQAAARAPPPCHHQSTHGSSSTAPARPADLDRERAVTVKVGDSATAKNLRRLTSEDLVKRAEKYRKHAAYKAISPTLMSVQFVAADMPCKALGPLKDEADRKRIAQELIANNRHAWGESCEIAHVGWLVRPPPGKKTSSIVIEFTTPHHANKAIETGTVWDFQVSENALYDRASRVVRCNNCQRYGHIGNICPHDTPRLVPRCANCKGDHTAWYKKCEVYIQEREKAQGRALHRPRYHRTPAYLQDPDGSATGSAALNASPNTERRTGTGSEMSGGLPVGARAASRSENVGSGGLSPAARDAPDHSPMEGLRFTENTPLSETNPPVGSTTIESTLTSAPTLPSTLPATTTRRSIASSGTEGTRRSLRLVSQIHRAIGTTRLSTQNETHAQTRSLSPRKRRRAQESVGPDTEIRGRTRSATTATASTLTYD
ncbi:hypothetical protein AARAC_011662 [Aspergillus arachidicola]|uniref:CCHC-type domain-containing protein n=1 Tax=Aspergillus arachidicola TaxID=656916 RepID=A0A2G7G394_9EURO|nr:hypothetical protein AARAC_011662 [Aspergillus arachidicola]